MRYAVMNHDDIVLGYVHADSEVNARHEADKTYGPAVQYLEEAPELDHLTREGK